MLSPKSAGEDNRLRPKFVSVRVESYLETEFPLPSEKSFCLLGSNWLDVAYPLYGGSSASLRVYCFKCLSHLKKQANKKAFMATGSLVFAQISDYCGLAKSAYEINQHTAQTISLQKYQAHLTYHF